MELQKCKLHINSLRLNIEIEMANMFTVNKKYAVYLALVSVMVLFINGAYCQSMPNDTLLHIVSQAPDPIRNDTYNLVEYFQSVTKDSAELVRLFVYWIAKNVDYDVEKLLSGDMTYTNVFNTLETRKTMCQGYSELICDMCYWADIECEVIRGYVKGFNYIEEPLEEPNHLWNVVFINSNWKIVDATWASGYMQKKIRTWKFVKKIREQFIFANPDSLIRTHFPEEEEWQLLEKAISIDEFYR